MGMKMLARRGTSLTWRRQLITALSSIFKSTNTRIINSKKDSIATNGQYIIRPDHLARRLLFRSITFVHTLDAVHSLTAAIQYPS